MDFQLNFSNIISKTLVVGSAKVLSQEDSKSFGPSLEGARKALFFTSKAKIMQFVWSTFMELFPHIILIA